MPKICINKVNYYYELHGSGDPIVLINGLKADHTGWMPILDPLSENNTVLIFDNLGTGQTKDDGTCFDVDRMADDTIALIRELNLVLPHIVGHSLGGAIAQSIAYRYPDEVKSVALCNTFIRFNDKSKDIFTDVLNMYQSGESQADIISAILPWVFSREFLNPELENIIRKASNEDPNAQTFHGYKRQLKALYSFDSNLWIQHINTPTLVIAAKNDKVASISDSEEIMKKINNARFVMLNAGHASQVEKPREFASELLSFYREFRSSYRLK